MSGYLVIGSNGRTIFIPASGFRDDDVLYRYGLSGDYWSRSLYSGNSYSAHNLGLYSGGFGTGDSGRYHGYLVRPVAEK